MKTLALAVMLVTAAIVSLSVPSYLPASRLADIYGGECNNQDNCRTQTVCAIGCTGNNCKSAENGTLCGRNSAGVTGWFCDLSDAGAGCYLVQPNFLTRAKCKCNNEACTITAEEYLLECQYQKGCETWQAHTGQ